MTLSIAPIVPATVAQATSLDVALQPDTVVTAQVLKRLDANLVKIAIANLTLDVATTIPLQPGQTLQLAVAQTKTGLSLTPVAPDAPMVIAQDKVATPRGNAVILDDIPLAANASPSSIAKPVLTPPEARAVAIAAQTAATQQSGLSPLFANLTSAVASGRLPQPVLLAATQLLALRQPRDQGFTGTDIKVALSSSGLLSEASRVSANVASQTTTQAMPDMKAALIVLRHTLATWLGPGSESVSAPSTPSTTVPQTKDASAAVVRISAAAIPIVPGQSPDVTAGKVDLAGLAKTFLTTPDATNLKSQVTIEIGENQSARNAAAPLVSSARAPVPPPFRDALPSAQSVAAPTLAPDAKPVTIAQHLIADTDGALARQTLLQIASLPDQASVPRADAMQPRWNFEIPFVTPQGTAMAQFEIARDGGGVEVEAAKRVWRARFSIDIEPAGPVHALISFSADTTSVKMWAERADTAATLRAGVPQLNQSLGRAALKTGDIVVADGAPSRTSSPRAGHFLNRAT